MFYIFTDNEVNETILAKDVIRKHYARLLEVLPLCDASFVAMMKKAKLFPADTYACMQAKATNEKRVNYILQHVVLPKAGIYLPKLLQVMKNSNCSKVASLADDIQQQLRGT